MKFVFRGILNLLWWDWAHVGIFIYKVSYRDPIYIHCYESRWGSRKIKMVNQRMPSDNSWKKDVCRQELYQTRIFPWLEGVPDPDVPTYKDVFCKKEEFINKLKGKEHPRIINDDKN